MQPFSALIGLGTFLGLLLVGWRAPRKEVIRYVDAAVIVLFLALVGSRITYVAVNWGYYGSHLGEVLQVWQGGLSSVGSLVGGVVGILIVAGWWRLPAGILADICLPLAGSVTVTSWLGCWAGTCAYGNSAQAWWALPARDEWGVLASRVPVQLIGALLSLLLLVLLELAAKRWSPGLAASLGWFGIAAILFGLSYVRADPAPVWNGLRLEAWGAVAMMVLSAALVVVLLVRWRLRPHLDPSNRAL